MSNYIVLFPGQGSQNKNMLINYDKNHIFNRYIDESSQILGYDIKTIVADESKLNNTIYTQPVMVATSIAIWNVFISQMDKLPTFAAGHSLGEYTALVANGTFSLEDCLNIVSERAKYMVDAMTGVEGGMAAVVSNNPELDLSSVVTEVCKKLSSSNELIQPVNYNSKSQIVIAGHRTLIDTCESEFKDQGVKRVVVLPVNIAAHSSIMETCSNKLYKVLNNIDIFEEKILFPILHNTDASEKIGKVDIIKSLCDQVCNPVLWDTTINNMLNTNITNFIEIGPGKVLTGLNRQILSNRDNVSNYTLDNIDTIKEVRGVCNV